MLVRGQVPKPAPTGYRPMGAFLKSSPGSAASRAPAQQIWYRKRYRRAMAMNLRLPDDLATELRERSDATGRSQQEIVRSAIETYLRDALQPDLSPWLRANIRPPIGPHVPLSTDRRVTGPTGAALTAALLSDRAAR